MESLSSTLYQSHPWEQWGMSSRDNIVTQLLWHNLVWGPQTCWSPDCPQISLGSLHSFSPVLSFIISQIPWRDAWTQFSHSLTHVCSWEHSLWSSSTLLCSLPFGLCHLPGAFDPSLLSSCLPCCCLPSSFKSPQQLLILLLPTLLLFKVFVLFLFGCNLLPWSFLTVRTLPLCTNLSFFFPLFLSVFFCYPSALLLKIFISMNSSQGWRDGPKLSEVAALPENPGLIPCTHSHL